MIHDDDGRLFHNSPFIPIFDNGLSIQGFINYLKISPQIYLMSAKKTIHANKLYKIKLHCLKKKYFSSSRFFPHIRKGRRNIVLRHSISNVAY